MKNLEHVKAATELGITYLYELLKAGGSDVDVLLDGFGDLENETNPDIIWYRFVQVNHWLTLSGPGADENMNFFRPYFKNENGEITTEHEPDDNGDYGWLVYKGPDYCITADEPTPLTKNQEKLWNWLMKKAGEVEVKRFLEKAERIEVRAVIEQEFYERLCRAFEQDGLIDVAGYALHRVYLIQHDYHDVETQYSTWSTCRKAAWEDARWYVRRFCK